VDRSAQIFVVVRVLYGVAAIELALGALLPVLGLPVSSMLVMGIASLITGLLGRWLKGALRKHGPEDWRFNWRTFWRKVAGGVS